MANPSLQDGIDQAGGVMDLLWKPGAEPFTVPVVPPEIAGSRKEQAAWFESVALLDLSHHMTDLFLEGPDALRLLTYLGANSFENFAIGQGKQFVPVTEEGLIVTDGILTRLGEDRFNLVGVPASQPWVMYHAEKGGYDVRLKLDPDSRLRGEGKSPVLFRYQIQGPNAEAFLEHVFGNPMPKIKFFHFAEVSLESRKFNAFRHGMVGQPGYEFIGPWEHGEYVKQAFLEAGEEFDLAEVGGKAYYSSHAVSGWIPTPLPAIYTSETLEDYRRHLSLYSYEGMRPLHGSYYSPDPADYYLSPFELGYDRSVAFNHNFLGRAALETAKDKVRRKKVSLVWQTGDAAQIFGVDRTLASWSRDRVEVGSKLVGVSQTTCYVDPMNAAVSLATIDLDHANPGTEVTVVWGEHPGGDADPNGDFDFVRVPAVVGPAPINDFARREYRHGRVRF
jgi:vanillate/3-O-methylgallate O-demethylase